LIYFLLQPLSKPEPFTGEQPLPLQPEISQEMSANDNFMMRKNLFTKRQNNDNPNAPDLTRPEADCFDYNSSMDILDNYGKRRRPKNDYVKATH